MHILLFDCTQCFPSEAGLCNNSQSVSGCAQFPSSTLIHQQPASSNALDRKGKRVNGKQGGDKGVLYGGGPESRDEKAVQKQRRHCATDTTTNTSSAEEATDGSRGTTRLDGRVMRCNLRRQQGRDKREGDAVANKLAVNVSEEESMYSSARGEDDTDTTDTAGVERGSASPTRRSLSPHCPSLSNRAERTDDLPAYVTPSRKSRRLRQLQDSKKRRLSSNQRLMARLHEQLETFDTQTKSEEMNPGIQAGGGSAKSLPAAERKISSYHLKQRGKLSHSSEATGTSETEDVRRNAGLRSRTTAQQKRKRSESSDLSESTATSKATGSTLRRERRSKRCVKFHESPDSSLERDKGAVLGTPKKTTTGACKVGHGDCNGGGVTDSGKSSSYGRRRKQGNPQKHLRNPRQKMTSRVHFSQHQVGSDGSSQSDLVAKHRNATEERSKSPNESKRTNSSHLLRHVVIHSTDSSSEGEPSEGFVLGMQLRDRRTRHQAGPASPAHRVVDLAGNSVEQSQPSSQWDYVAVQTIAAAAATNKTAQSPANPSCSLAVSTHTPHQGTSDIESEHERTSIFTCSSDEFVMSTQVPRPYSGGDKLSVVSESSPGTLSPQLQPALHFVRRLRKRAH